MLVYLLAKHILRTNPDGCSFLFLPDGRKVKNLDDFLSVPESPHSVCLFFLIWQVFFLRHRLKDGGACVHVRGTLLDNFRWAFFFCISKNESFSTPLCWKTIKESCKLRDYGSRTVSHGDTCLMHGDAFAITTWHPRASWPCWPSSSLPTHLTS